METIEDVKRWLRAMGERGLYGGSSVRIRTTALERLTSVMGDDDPTEVSWIVDNIETLTHRWATRNQANPATAATYKSRALSTLRDFVEYHENPTGFRGPRRRRNAKATGASGGSTGRKQTAKDTSERTENRSVAVDASTQSFSFVLSGGRRAQLVVPMKLGRTDITILKKQLELLELQVEVSESSGDIS